MPATIDAVGQHTVHELRYAIEETTQREDDTEARLGDAILGGETGHRKRKVLTDKVEEDVANHRADDGTPLPILEFFLLFRCHFIVCFLCYAMVLYALIISATSASLVMLVTSLIAPSKPSSAIFCCNSTLCWSSAFE